MRKICIYTSSRAEYGLLRGVLQEIKAEPTLQLQIFASGMHLSPEFGMTIQEIRDDGFEADETIEILLSSDTPTAICKSMGLALIGYGEALQRLKPDMVVVLGDRFEIFCMAAAAQVCRIPLTHIHGGETTEGAIDEAFRHSITKMSHLHFASCEVYRQRIIQLGEAPDRVFNVGALGVENIRRMSLMGRSELAAAIGFNLDKPYFLVTFHPVTLEKSTSEGQFQSLLDALDAFPEYNVIFTKANADTDGRVINRMIDEYTKKRPERCLAVTSLGVHRYLSAMKYATAVIGNSSSGIVEAPSFKIPTINIGDRQKGRLQADSILNCSPDANAIRQTIGHALSLAFQENLSGISNPYDRPGTCSTIVRLLEKTDIFGITKKTFHDVRFP
ncbi:MAG: UDP-N-acetylglucosamine 2-epimerase (hydrolyzing) [Euryarchaeota archaeon]|nr:UDP-N-acetylglucosamine 2-epimerase (hydrolyzing) [Euryarchaeota archaeon]MCG2727964.1 UDP-N-acetylglucosamine 2-epimerase [Candidatus Methanoperedenaceae archaeon]